MNAEQTLGEILGEALRAPPLVSEEDAQYLSALGLIQHIFDTDIADDYALVWDELSHVPDSALAHLETPLGWAVLSAMIADNIGSAGAAVMPQIH